MEVSSKHQLFVFVIYVVSGMGCGMFFDVQRSIRKVISAGKIRTLLEDIVFVFFCTVAAMLAGYLFDRGQIRYYQVMGLISGALFYTAFLSRIAMKILAFLYELLRKMVIKPLVLTVRIILSPFLKIYLILRSFCIKIKVYSSKTLRSIKVKRNKVKKRMKML